VLHPEVRTGAYNAMRFPCESRGEHVPYAIVRFEELDAIRECRGEIRPYEPADEHAHFLDRWNPFSSIRDGAVESKTDWEPPSERYPWVWEIENSPWLGERHAYEETHYRHPLIPDFVHYLFRFHDEYVEAIARGIWFHVADHGWDMPEDVLCPFGDLPEDAPGERGVEAGIDFILRRNPVPLDELLNRSSLCSQTVLQFGMYSDGKLTSDWPLHVRRFRDGRVLAQFGSTWFFRENMHRFDHVPSETRLLDLWLSHVRDVATRRLGRSKNG
jgi:hypothetical protein